MTFVGALAIPRFVLILLCLSLGQVFAAVTADAKFQIWDISVSEIDPIISLDTNLDHELTEVERTTATPSIAQTAKKAATPSQTRREFGVRGDPSNRDENDKETPVTRLLKHLSQRTPARRTLTAVTFSENSPVAVVGDSKGILTVYRVNEPVIVSDISNPAAQTMKLKEAVWRQADPSDVAKLQSAPVGSKNENPNNGEKVTAPNSIH